VSTNNGKPLQVAVVGLGYWGPNLVRNLHDVPGASLRWICDLREDNLERIGRRYPAVARTTSFDEVLSDPEVDAIAVATPVSILRSRPQRSRPESTSSSRSRLRRPSTRRKCLPGAPQTPD
jgi:hypothetical protein